MSKLRELLGKLGLAFQLDLAMVEKIEELEQRVYALEENRKMKDQTIKSLEHRYSELQYIVGSLKKELSKVTVSQG